MPKHEPASSAWRRETSEVVRELRTLPPSKRVPDRRQRISKAKHDRVVAAKDARISELEAALAAWSPPQSVEIKGGQSLKTRSSLPVPERVDLPSRKSDDSYEQPRRNPGEPEVNGSNSTVATIVDRRPPESWFAERVRRESERRERELLARRKGSMAGNLRAHGWRG